MSFYYNSGAARNIIDANFIKEVSNNIILSDIDGNIILKDGINITNNISIENNEVISFDFSKIKFEEAISGTKFFKAIIEFGDGESKTISSFITNNYSVINSVWDDWTFIEHEYNFQENKPGTLKIIFYSTAGDKAVVSLNFNITFKSIYELGTNFELISANINSKNNVSYMLRHADTDSIIMANSKQ